MATLTLTIADNQVARVVNAIYANNHAGALPATQAIGVQFVRQWLYDQAKAQVKGDESMVAARAIADRADDPLDLTVQ